ncbi:hypothetical protein V6N13_045175 [Hibiscus sabdariffa]
MSRTTSVTPEIGLGSFNHIDIEGTNSGATMSVRRGISDKPEGCCCINIYTNSNVQGTNSSVLVGSKIKMKNPGVHLYFGDLKFGHGQSISRSSTGRTAGAPLDFGSIFLFVFVPLESYSSVGDCCIRSGTQMVHGCFEERFEVGKGEWPWRLMAFQRLGFTAADILACIKETNVVGMGATGVVYKAEMPQSNAVVPVKKLWRF